MKQTPNDSTPRTRRHGTPWRLMWATATLALAGATLQPAFAQPFEGHGGGRGDHHGHYLGRMLDGVDATDAQRSQIRQIMQAARTDLKPLHESGRQLRQQTQALFAMACSRRQQLQRACGSRNWCCTTRRRSACCRPGSTSARC